MENLAVSGNMFDVCAYLEKEAERYPKMTVQRYLKLKALEKEEEQRKKGGVTNEK